MTMEYPVLLKKCEDVYETISFSFNQANIVEEMTRSQADSKLWFQQRAGQITASKLCNVCTPTVRSHQFQLYENMPSALL